MENSFKNSTVFYKTGITKFLIMMKYLPLILFSFLLFSCQMNDKIRLSSPDENHQLVLTVEGDSVLLSYSYKGTQILKKSPIGLKTNSEITGHISLGDVGKSHVDTTWNPVAGKSRSVRDNYNQYVVHLQERNSPLGIYDIVFRCYDDGFAYRYIIDSKGQKPLQVEGDLTTLNFSDKPTYWAYNGERPNVGPLGVGDTSMTVRIPMVLKLRENCYMAIHEADISQYTPFTLQTTQLKNSLSVHIDPTDAEYTLKTSWRTFIVGNQPGDLVGSNLLDNLNEPCKIEDTSWIKPGMSMWDWRVWGYKAPGGFVYELNTPSHKRLIDFASKNNIQYLLIDADWYGPEFNDNSDPTVARKGINIEETISYAKERGVGLILYLNDVGAKKFGLERVLKQFSAWGAVGVKYGFMKGSWEQKVRHTREVIKLCAKYKLMVDFHDGPVPPNGDDRTYPNVMAREFCHAQADAKRSYFPETAVSSAFINMIAGKIDYTNGWFDLNHAQSRVRVFEEIPGTVSAEVAKLIVAYTGWMVLPDAPEAYLAKSDLFECIKEMPPQFDSFKVLQGDIDKCIVVARAAGEDWFIGSLTNREGRDVEIDLGFLPKGSKYLATIYSDADDSNFLTNKESYKIEEQKVEPGTKLKVRLAPGGGNAIHLKKL